MGRIEVLVLVFGLVQCWRKVCCWSCGWVRMRVEWFGEGRIREKEADLKRLIYGRVFEKEVNARRAVVPASHTRLLFIG